MSRWGAVVSGLILTVLLGACGDDASSGGPDAAPEPPPPGPYDDVPLTQDLRVEGVTGAVHVARDEFGIAHIHADSEADLYFAQGYVMAHDRLPQMDILRRFGAGTVAELFGIDADALETDFEMRPHQMRATAMQALAELKMSDDPVDIAMVTALESFAAGVNQYAADLKAGKYELDTRLLASFDPERFAAWDAVDCLTLGRFQAFALSWTTPIELDVSDIYQQARSVFDQADPGEQPGRAARAGFAADVLRFRPIERTSTIDGFPNVDVDTGSRSNDVSAIAQALAPAATTTRRPPVVRAFAPGPKRPVVPRELLTQARRAFAPKAIGPHAIMVPRAGSNNWVVGPEHTGGVPMIAGDQHLSLPNPSIFYPCHLVVPGQLDVQGITFPGIPGIILGHNGKVAWSATVVFHDVNDVYLETIAPCDGGGGDCVDFDGGQVPIETFDETFNVGSLGTIFETKTVTYERVPHHGFIIPNIGDREVIPRSGNQALSVRYTGHQVSQEFRYFYLLNRAGSVAEAFASVDSFSYGGQNWVFIDATGNIGWTTHAKVPLRDPAAMTWDAVDNPDGVAPFLVLPGDGSAEWQGFLDPRYIPHAYNPDKGYIVTANSDPVGATFDGDPLDQTVVDGNPLFASATYAPGPRTARITALLEERIASGDPITLDDMARIQADSQSNLGRRYRPFVVAAVGAIDADTPADVAAWLATLDAARVERLRAGGALLAAWSLETPPAVEGSPTADELRDSAATSLFNVWAHFAMAAVFGDELAALDWDIYDVNENLSTRMLLAVFEEPETLVSGLAPQTGQPVVCDSLATPRVESCTLVALQALDQAMAHLESEAGFGTADANEWHWGALHTLVLEPLFPNNELNVPPPNEPDPLLRNGYPRAGDMLAVNRADCTWEDLDFSQVDGPAQRFLARPVDGVIKARMALPGGTVYNPPSPHYRDLMDEYYVRNRHFDLPFSTPEIVSAGEERWVIRGK